MDEKNESIFDQFYPKGNVTKEEVRIAILRKLEELGLWPHVKETDLWRANKTTTIIIALALGIPYPIPEQYQAVENLFGVPDLPQT